MRNRTDNLRLGFATAIGAALFAYSSFAQSPPHGQIVLAQSSPQQAQCQQEAAQLSAQLAQCTTDACRQNVQAAIAAHNQRCQ
jgi:hypothetical protein